MILDINIDLLACVVICSINYLLKNVWYPQLLKFNEALVLSQFVKQ